MSTILFTKVNILEGESSALVPGEVLVEGNRIKTVALEGETITRDGVSEVIDGGGACLMPGMINPHCHFTYCDATSLADTNSLPV